MPKHKRKRTKFTVQVKHPHTGWRWWRRYASKKAAIKCATYGKKTGFWQKVRVTQGKKLNLEIEAGSVS